MRGGVAFGSGRSFAPILHEYNEFHYGFIDMSHEKDVTVDRIFQPDGGSSNKFITDDDGGSP
jgi:hypothetical protein